jgi:hypothetical protein
MSLISIISNFDIAQSIHFIKVGGNSLTKIFGILF